MSPNISTLEHSLEMPLQTKFLDETCKLINCPQFGKMNVWNNPLPPPPPPYPTISSLIPYAAWLVFRYLWWQRLNRPILYFAEYLQWSPL